MWNDGDEQTINYGDVFYQNEMEQSAYNFEYADAKMLMRHFQDYERMCQLLIKKKLPLPAYEQVIMAVHAFNVLEARRALSVAERQRYILRTRTLARCVAELYLSVREDRGSSELRDSSLEDKNDEGKHAQDKASHG